MTVWPGDVVLQHEWAETVREPTVECDHCGLCCKNLIVEIGHVDVVREPRIAATVEPCRTEARTGDEWVVPENPWDREYILTQTGGCPMLGADKLCAVYPTRPNACVAFEAGGPQCQQLRYEAGLPPLGRDAWPTDPVELASMLYPYDELI